MVQPQEGPSQVAYLLLYKVHICFRHESHDLGRMEVLLQIPLRQMCSTDIEVKYI